MQGENNIHGDVTASQKLKFIIGEKEPTSWGYLIFNFLLIFLPIIIFCSIFLNYIYRTEFMADNRIIRNQEINKVKVQSEIIYQDLDVCISDLMIIKNLHELCKLVNRLTFDTKDLENDLQYFSSHKKLYDQIRYLDENGAEIVRINYNDGKVKAIPKRQLQNKRKRYYFTDAIILDKGEVFMSPMDLNIERGQIEIPVKPMIRFATPIFDKQGNKRGIVLLNYLGQILLDHIKQLADKGIGQVSFLNSDGNWLKAPKQEDEWGFMYEERKNRSFKNRYPEVWQEMLKHDSGEIRNREGFFTYQTIYPLAKGVVSSTGSGKAYSPSKENVIGRKYFFKLVSHIPAVVFTEKSSQIAQNLWNIYWMIMGFLVVASAAFAYFRESKRKQRVEREKLIAELKNAVSEIQTLQGIIPICSHCKKIRDDAGAWDQLEEYFHKHTLASFTHGICPDCIKKHYSKYVKDENKHKY